MRYYGLGFEADTSTKNPTAGVKWDRRVLITEFSYRGDLRYSVKTYSRKQQLCSS